MKNLPQCGINKGILFPFWFCATLGRDGLPCELAAATLPRVKSVDLQNHAHSFFSFPLFFLLLIGSDVWEAVRLGAARALSHASLQLAVFELRSDHVTWKR